MKKRIFIFAVIAIVLTIGIVGLIKLNNVTALFHNANRIYVTADSPLVSEAVNIEHGMSVNTINRANDLDLFENRDKYSVLFDGEEQLPLLNEYGENDFLVTYDNQYYFSFRQFKTNWRHQHDYIFHFYKRQDTIRVQVEILGLNAMKFDRPMPEMDNAAAYVGNTPVDGAIDKED